MLEQLTMLVFFQLILVGVHEHMQFTGGQFLRLLARCRVLFITCKTRYKEIHGTGDPFVSNVGVPAGHVH